MGRFLGSIGRAFVLLFALACGACSSPTVQDGGADASDAHDDHAATHDTSPADASDAPTDAAPSDVAVGDATDAGSDAQADAASDSAGDGGSVELCSAMLVSRSNGCAAADVGLSTEICRCGSRFYWSGTACVGTAACRCTRNCDLLFATQPECERAYAACLPDASVRD